MFMTGASMYKIFIDDFSEYCLIAPDIAMHGDDKSEFTTLQNEAKILQEQLIENGITDIKLVFAMSLGARLVLDLIQNKG